MTSPKCETPGGQGRGFQNTHENRQRDHIDKPQAVQHGCDASPLLVTNDEFMAAIFGETSEQERPLVCSVPVDPTGKGWPVIVCPCDTSNDALNWYVQPATYKPDAKGVFHAKKELSVLVYCIMLDDIGTKVKPERLDALPPSWLIETSPGNYQAGYIFKRPISGKQADALKAACIAAGVCDAGASGGATRWMRLPVGINGKPQYGTPSPQCRLTEWYPDRRYTPEEIIKRLGLVLPQDTCKEKGKVKNKKHTAPDMARARSALAAVASPDDRDEWIALMRAACAAGLPVDDGIAHSWRDVQTAAKVREIWGEYDPGREDAIGAGTLFYLAREAGWVDPAPHQDGMILNTDLWLSNKFADRFKDTFRYDHSAQQWRTWCAGCWGLCQQREQVEAMKELAKILLGEAIEELKKNHQSPRFKHLMKVAERAQSVPAIESALKLAQSLPTIRVRAEDFDQDPDLFNCANGVIHLPTGELRPHDPSLMLSKHSPIEYDPGAVCPLFEAFMGQVSTHALDVPDDAWVDYLQRTIGYGLGGYVGEEKMSCWIGNGANGKSVLANIITFIWGNYAGVAPASFLMQKRDGGGGATPELAGLAGKRVVLVNEVESGAKMSGQMVKVATSTEPISARGLYCDYFVFKPTHKLILRGNHRPVIMDNDDGIWRRIALVPFDLKLTPEQRDQGLEARLLNEAPGILAWCVRGFQKWRVNGLKPCARVGGAVKDYRKESDVVGQWLEEQCDESDGVAVDQQDVYRDYRAWCDANGLHAFTKMTFTMALKERGFKVGQASKAPRGKTYLGFSLRDTPTAW